MHIEGILVLSGSVRSGKTTLANTLSERYGMGVFKTHNAIEGLFASQVGGDRIRLQAEGARLDRLTKGRWVQEELRKWLATQPHQRYIVVDSVRIDGQVLGLREAFGGCVVHIHLTAPDEVLKSRFRGVASVGIDRNVSYATVKSDPTELQVGSLAAVADAVIDTDPAKLTSSEVAVKAMGYLRSHSGRTGGYVDVIVGGQYGSEGKGQVAAYLAQEYDLLVRVGGPNAGHSVYAEPVRIVHHSLPSGTTKSRARLLLGPGAVIDREKLIEEIAKCGGLEVGRLLIDRGATLITEQDKLDEQEIVKSIGSTGQGVGAATARRITGRGKSPGPRLARDDSELKGYLCDAVEVLERAFAENQRILLEGTQGTGLSLYHGEYPWVTSRDTTVSGCLAEAGIPPSHLRRVLMVCRTYPIRVQDGEKGTSGPMVRETTLEKIAETSGKDLEELRLTEKTSTTKRKRRIGEFDWALFRRAVQLNGPTDIVLTFADYITEKNGSARRLDQLSSDTLSMIREIERVGGVPVSMVSTGFNSRCIIDLRAW
jgi:adenylosuccinate synthase